MNSGTHEFVNPYSIQCIQNFWAIALTIEEVKHFWNSPKILDKKG